MIAFKFPDIGEGIAEGVLLKWLVKVGDSVKEGDSLCEMETDKVNAELPSPAAGIVKETRGAVGDTIQVGDILVLIDDGSEASPGAGEISESSGISVSIEPVEEENAGVVGALEVSNEVVSNSEEGRETGEAPTVTQRRILATPVARKMAYDLGIKIEEIEGTGPMGRVMKADILRLKEQTAAIPATTAASEAQAVSTQAGKQIKLSSLRKTIAKRMTQSLYTAPHTTMMQEIDVTELVSYRESVKGLFLEEKGISITLLPFIIKAVVNALRENPKFNGQLEEGEETYLIKDDVHIGIAVDTSDGLLVPVIRNAPGKGILQLMEEIQRLSSGARERSIQIEDLKGSTFTISNYGSLGATFGTPIINYPEVAILGIGAITQKPVLIDGEIAVRWMLPLSLSIDHRVLDGGDAGRFVQSFKQSIQSPNRLLLT